MDKRDALAGSSQVLVQIVNISDQVNEHNDRHCLDAVEDLHQSEFPLAIVSHELYPLLDCLLVANLSNLDECRELEVLSGHLFDKRLHGG